MTVRRVGNSYDKDEDKAHVLGALATLPDFVRKLLPQTTDEADGLVTYLGGHRHSTQFRHFGKEYPEIELTDDCLDTWLTKSVTRKTATEAGILLKYIMWKLAPEFNHADSEMKSSAERGESGYHRLVTLQNERFAAGEDTQAKTWGQSVQHKLEGIARDNTEERKFLYRRIGYLCDKVWTNHPDPVHVSVSYLDAKFPLWDDGETDQSELLLPLEACF